MFWHTIIICVCFSTPIETPPKHGFWTLYQHLLATKIFDHAFFSWCAGIKRSHWVPSQGWTANSTFWPVRKALVWADVWELTLAWWTMMRNPLLFFWNSPKTLGKQIVVYHSELPVLWCSSGTVATWPVLQKTQVTFCFEVLLSNKFRWIWLGFKDPHGGLLLCFGLIRKCPLFVMCDDLINVFWGTAFVFFQHFFTPIDTNLFLIVCQIVR